MSNSSGDKTLIFGLLFLIIGNQLHDLTILFGAAVLIAIGVTLEITHYIVRRFFNAIFSFISSLWELKYYALLGIACLWLLLIGFPAFSQVTYSKEIVSTLQTSFNDTVVMVDHNYVWWSGSTTKITFQTGINATRSIPIKTNITIWNIFTLAPQNYTLETYTVKDFVFSGNLEITVGQSYWLEYKLLTRRDGSQEISLISIIKR